MSIRAEAQIRQVIAGFEIAAQIHSRTSTIFGPSCTCVVTTPRSSASRLLVKLSGSTPSRDALTRST